MTRDPDVIITGRGTIRVLHRPGESQEDYIKRLVAAAPPLSEHQREVLRNAFREYWQIVHERREGKREAS